MTLFRNRMAWALWIFTAIWMTFLALMVTLRDGPPDGYSWPLIWAILFTSRITFSDGATADLAEGHDEATIEAVTARFNARAGRRRGPDLSPST